MNTTRVIAAVAALFLSASLAPTAQADPPDAVVRLLITCPTAAEVAGIIGEDTTLSEGWPEPDCYYDLRTEYVTFTLWDLSVQETREGIETPQDSGYPGQPVSDVSGWGPGAFQYEREGHWYVTYQLQDVSATLVVPPRFKEDAAALAQLFAAATFPRPVPTVAPRAFTATCPSAKDVGRVMGETMKVQPVEEPNTCDYIGKEHVKYSISDTFGSVADARIDQDLTFKNSTVTVHDFAGLGDGAFYWADASPFFLTWQLRDGVVAELYGGRGGDESRLLARLFEDVQVSGGGKPSTPKPSKPGLPTTGD